MAAEIGSSRADAIARGLRLYMSDKPCKNGSFGPRQMNTRCVCDACKAKTKATGAAWREANKASILARVREWQHNNRDRMNAATKRWTEANPEIKRAAFDRRTAAVKQAKPSWYEKQWDSFVIREALHLAKLRTEVTGIEWQRDHLIPLQGQLACGLHCASNIQVIPAALNHWKHSRLLLTEPGEWIKYL